MQSSCALIQRGSRCAPDAYVQAEQGHTVKMDDSRPSAQLLRGCDAQMRAKLLCTTTTRTRSIIASKIHTYALTQQGRIAEMPADYYLAPMRYCDEDALRRCAPYIYALT